MNGLRALLSRLPRGLLLWAALSAVCFIGAVTAIVGIVSVPGQELERARADGQHLTIDPVTGAVIDAPKKAVEASAETADTHHTDEAKAAAKEEEKAHGEEAEKSEEAPAAAPTEEGKPVEDTTAHEQKPEGTAPAHTESPAAEATKPEAASSSPEAQPSAPTSTATHSETPAAAAGGASAAAETSTAEKSAHPSTTAASTTAPALVTQATVAEIPSVAVSAESTVAPGAREITEMLDGHPVPKRGENGMSAGTLYAKSYTLAKDAKDKTRVSIVLMDAGLNRQSVAAILALPRMVTVAFSPYAPDGPATIVKLHAAGFETWGMLPVMGARYPKDDPGPLGLIASLPPEENQRRLHAVMTNTLGAAGLMLPPEEALSEHKRAFAPVVNEVIARGLWLISTHPTRSVDSLTGGDKNLRASIRRADVLIDANATAAEVQSKLDGLKTLIAKQTSLIVVVPARPQLLALLGDWLAHNGLGTDAELAPLSALYKVVKTAEEPPPEADSHAGGGEAKHESKPDAPVAQEKKEHGAH